MTLQRSIANRVLCSEPHARRCMLASLCRLQLIKGKPKALRPPAVALVSNAPTMARLRSEVLRRLPQCGDIALANIAWAHAEVALGPPELQDAMLVVLVSRKDAPTGRTFASAFRMCAVAPAATRRNLVSAAVHRAELQGFAGWQSQAMATTTWALAALGVAPASALSALARSAADSVKTWPARDAIQLLWALAKAGHGRSAGAIAVWQHVSSCTLEQAAPGWRAQRKTPHRVRGAPGADYGALNNHLLAQLAYAVAREAQTRLYTRHGQRTGGGLDAQAWQKLWPEVPVALLTRALMRQALNGVHQLDVRARGLDMLCCRQGQCASVSLRPVCGLHCTTRADSKRCIS